MHSNRAEAPEGSRDSNTTFGRMQRYHQKHQVSSGRGSSGNQTCAVLHMHRAVSDQQWMLQSHIWVPIYSTVTQHVCSSRDDSHFTTQQGGCRDWRPFIGVNQSPQTCPPTCAAWCFIYASCIYIYAKARDRALHGGVGRQTAMNCATCQKAGFAWEVLHRLMLLKY